MYMMTMYAMPKKPSLRNICDHAPPFPSVMKARLADVVTFLLGIVDVVYVACALILFSAIIAWLSLQFSVDLPAALCFTAGALSLVTGATSVLLLAPQKPNLFAKVVCPLASLVTAAATLGLLVAFSLSYGPRSELQVCSQCPLRGTASAECVAGCHDECCFTTLSEPLVNVIIATAACVVLNSLLSFLFGTVYIYSTSTPK